MGPNKLVLVEAQWLTKLVSLAEEFFEALAKGMDLRKYEYELN